MFYKISSSQPLKYQQFLKQNWYMEYITQSLLILCSINETTCIKNHFKEHERPRKYGSYYTHFLSIGCDVAFDYMKILRSKYNDI